MILLEALADTTTNSGGQIYLWQAVINIGALVTFIISLSKVKPFGFDISKIISDIFFGHFKEEMNTSFSEIDKKIDNLKKEFNEELSTITASQQQEEAQITQLFEIHAEAEVQRLRWEIMEFSNSIENGNLHTKGEYLHIKDMCKSYHKIIEERGISNGIIDDEEKKISDHYEEHKDSPSLFF